MSREDDPSASYIFRWCQIERLSRIIETTLYVAHPPCYVILRSYKASSYLGQNIVIAVQKGVVMATYICVRILPEYNIDHIYIIYCIIHCYRGILMPPPRKRT